MNILTSHRFPAFICWAVALFILYIVFVVAPLKAAQVFGSMAALILFVGGRQDMKRRFYFNQIELGAGKEENLVMPGFDDDGKPREFTVLD